MGMIINNALGATATANPSTMWPLALIVVIFIFFLYFSVWRPQNQRVKQQKHLMTSLKVGDEVTTLGGLVGKVAKLKDNFVILSVTSSVDIVIQKLSIATILPKGSLKNIREEENHRP